MHNPEPAPRSRGGNPVAFIAALMGLMGAMLYLGAFAAGRAIPDLGCIAIVCSPALAIAAWRTAPGGTDG